MGSYNHTCGISHLPIQDGDAVTAFLLTRPVTQGSGDFDGWTGTGPEWQVASLPILGAYDDEGSLVPDAAGNGAADALAQLVTGRSIQGILDVAAEGGDPGALARRPMALRLVMVHRDLYERLSSEGGDVAYAAESARVREYLDTMREAWAARERAVHGREPVASYGNMGEIEDWCEHTGRDWREAPYALRVFDRDAGISPVLRMALVALLNKARAAGEADREIALMGPALRLRILDRNMLALRRAWAPQAGLGQSDEDHGLHRAVAEWTAGRCLDAERDDEPEAAPGP